MLAGNSFFLTRAEDRGAGAKRKRFRRRGSLRSSEAKNCTRRCASHDSPNVPFLIPGTTQGVAVRTGQTTYGASDAGLENGCLALASSRRGSDLDLKTAG